MCWSTRLLELVLWTVSKAHADKFHSLSICSVYMHSCQIGVLKTQNTILLPRIDFRMQPLLVVLLLHSLKKIIKQKRWNIVLQNIIADSGVCFFFPLAKC